MTIERLGECGVDIELYRTKMIGCRIHGEVNHVYRNGKWQCNLCRNQRWSG
jgi:phosphopantetheinyl transferase